jgi:ABC-type bacteriocin/lantibiotic exporter with double-glycine peptidase domain
LSLPLGVQAIIGLITSGSLPTTWTIMVIVVTLGVLVVGILNIFQLIITEMLKQRIFVRSAYEFALRIPRFAMEKLRQRYAPELINRFFDTLTIQKGLPKVLMDFSRSILEIVFGMLLLSLYHPVFILFGLVLFVLLGLIFRLTGPSGLRTSLVESTYKYQVAHWLEEVARSGATFKLWGGTQLHLEKTDRLVSLYLEARKKHFKILVVQFASIVFFRTLITAGLLIIGSVLVIQGAINIGQFVAAEIIILLVINAAEKLIESMETIYDMLTAIEKIKSIADLPLEESGGREFSDVDTGKGIEIEAENLNFSFTDSKEPVLRNISFKLNAGEHVCVAGFNGSGKSTLLRLLTGVFTEFTGKLSYNGVSIKSFALDNLRSYIGDHSPQEELFEGTLAENIGLATETCGVKDMIWAIEAVGLKSWFSRLPQGLDTAILPGGQTLPGSVIKKLILARSIVNHPRLLVMEEFLDNMEPADKRHIVEFLTQENHNWTLVIISNDEEVAKACDRVLVLDDGKVRVCDAWNKISDLPHCKNLFKG